MPRGRVVGLVVGGVAVALAAVAVVTVAGGDQRGPEREVSRYLAAWGRSDFEAMSRMTIAPPPAFASQHQSMHEDLQVTRWAFVPRGVEDEGEGVRARFRATLSLRGLGDWAYTGHLDMRRRDERWMVAWTPATIHPELSAGHRLGRSRTRPERAAIVDAGGQALTSLGEVVSVGVEPARITDRARVEAALREQTGVDPDRVAAALDRPGLRPDVFVPFIDLREERFAAARPALAPVPGIVFRRKAARLTPSEGFARHVLGRTGEVTAEALESLGPLYQPGDVVGLSGIESALERKLAGTPSGEVRVLDGAGSTTKVVHRFTGSAPTPVTLTLDREQQAAAEQALEGVAQPSAIVVVDGQTGAVRAAASRPLDQPFNRAMAGRYPPGSTFKVVTTAALLGTGLTPSTTVACPAEAVVGGKRFRNFEGEARGDIAFAQAFFQSCNTAFVSQSRQVTSEQLAAAASRFGFGARYDPGIGSFGGRFPEPADDAEKAAAAIGQGRVEASPLHMASVAAAVADGSWRAPHVVAREEGGGGPESPPLEPDVAAALQELMAGVVREGSGRAAAVAGQDIGGKTGTSEFGQGTPLPTHAWFIGYRGSLGFSVLIEGGGVGGRVAAPVAARFLAAAPPR